MALTRIRGDAVQHSAMPTGAVLQIQQASYTTRGDINSTGDTVIFGVSITPKFSTSKVLVRMNLDVTHHNYYSGLIRCQRVISGGATTLIGGGVAFGSNAIANVWMNVRKAHRDGETDDTLDIYSYHSYSHEHLDSPSTTSAITYNALGRSVAGGANLHLNRTSQNSDQEFNSAGFCTMTATEVAG